MKSKKITHLLKVINKYNLLRMDKKWNTIKLQKEDLYQDQIGLLQMLR